MTPLEHMMIAYKALEGNPEFSNGRSHSVVFHLGAALKAYERHVDVQQTELDKIQHMPEDVPE